MKKGDPPVVGLTKLSNGVTLEQLKKPRREVPLGSEKKDTTSESQAPAS